MAGSDRNFGIVPGLAALLLVTMAGSARAGEAALLPEELDEVVVTAQKRRDLLRDTPLSVTVLTANALQQMGATQLRDLAGSVPGLGFTSPGAGEAQINLRGVTTGGNVSPTVGIYVDEVPYGSSTPFAGGAQLALDVGLFDMDRVEVLRGPQGTLYGASTMGGLVKYVPARPDHDAFSRFMRAGLGNTQHGGMNHELAATVNVPFGGGTAALRVGGYHVRDGGHVDDVQLGLSDVDTASILGGRAELSWAPLPELSVRVAVFAQDIDRDGTTAADRDLASGAPIDGPLLKRGALAEPFAQEFRLVSGTVDYALGFADLISVSSFQRATVESRADASDLYVPLLASLVPGVNAVGVDKHIVTERLTQEIRLSATGNRLDWLAGAFFTHETSDQGQDVPILDASGQLLPVNLATIELPSGYRETAAFATLTWHATERLDLTAGARQARNRLWQEQLASGLTAQPLPERRTHESVTTFLAGLRYRFSERLMGYLRLANGYRPGGPNLVANDPVSGQPIADPSFDSDSLISHELGVKFSSADRRFSLDAAIYQIDWDDLQVIAVRNGVGVIDNASEARNRGAELQMNLRPMPRLSLAAAVGWMNAELSQDAPDLGASRGDALPNTPEFTVSVSGDHAFNVSGREAWLGLAVRHAGRRVSSFEGNAGQPLYRLPAYTVLDLRGGIELGSWRLQANIRNVTNRRGQVSAGTGSTVVGAPARVAMMQPRTYGVTLSTN